MSRSLKVISHRLAHCPFYSPIGVVHAHARTRAELETKGGRARAKTTCSGDWGREAQTIYSTRRRYSRLFERQRSRALTLHTHTQISKKERKKKNWQMVHQFTPPETPYLTLIGYNYIWEYMSNSVLRGLPCFLTTYS